MMISLKLTPGRGLPYGSGLGLSKCLGPDECMHSFIHSFMNTILIIVYCDKLYYLLLFFIVLLVLLLLHPGIK